MLFCSYIRHKSTGENRQKRRLHRNRQNRMGGIAMKKIMFNDRYGLTRMVIKGRKMQSRRIVPQSVIEKYSMMEDPTIIDDARYDVGEVVAVAESYCSIVEELENVKNATCAGHFEKNVEKAGKYLSWIEHPGFSNKMFVSADMMLHQIRITDVRVERLQDISEEDCLKEGIQKMLTGCEDYQYSFYDNDKSAWNNHKTPQEAFAHLINKVSRKDVWAENPYVFVYDFELVKQ